MAEPPEVATRVLTAGRAAALLLPNSLASAATACSLVDTRAGWHHKRHTAGLLAKAFCACMPKQGCLTGHACGWVSEGLNCWAQSEVAVQALGTE